MNQDDNLHLLPIQPDAVRYNPYLRTFDVRLTINGTRHIVHALDVGETSVGAEGRRFFVRDAVLHQTDRTTPYRWRYLCDSYEYAYLQPGLWFSPDYLAPGNWTPLPIPAFRSFFTPPRKVRRTQLATRPAPKPARSLPISPLVDEAALARIWTLIETSPQTIAHDCSTTRRARSRLIDICSRKSS
jgi:hypothetical protein